MSNVERLPGRRRKYVSSPSPHRTDQESWARLRRRSAARWKVDPFLWRMDATEYNVQWPLYDPPSRRSNGGKKCITTLSASVLPSVRRVRRRRDAAEAAIRHAPGRWLVTSTASIVRRADGVEGLGEEGRESLLDVRQRRTSMLRGKCGVTSPRVVNSQELSCTQRRRRGIKKILRSDRYQGRENRQCFD